MASGAQAPREAGKLSSTLMSLPFMQRGRKAGGGAAGSAAAPGPAAAAAPEVAAAAAVAVAVAAQGAAAGKPQLSDRLKDLKFMQRAAHKRSANDAFGDEDEARRRDAEAHWVLPADGNGGSGGSGSGAAAGRCVVVVCDRDPLPDALAGGAGRMSFRGFNPQTEARAAEAAAGAAAAARAAAEAARDAAGGVVVSDEAMAARLGGGSGGDKGGDKDGSKSGGVGSGGGGLGSGGGGGLLSSGVGSAGKKKGKASYFDDGDEWPQTMRQKKRQKK